MNSRVIRKMQVDVAKKLMWILRLWRVLQLIKFLVLDIKLNQMFLKSKVME